MTAILSGLLGGSLIGTSAASLLLLTGDVLGASGIVSSVALNAKHTFKDPSQQWKLVFLASFLLVSFHYFSSAYTDKNGALSALSPTAYALGGLFVGFGTKLGNGCTSGHGICGLARLSRRSFAAVSIFITTAIITTYLTQPSTSPFPDHLKFLRTRSDTSFVYDRHISGIITMFAVVAAMISPTFHEHAKDQNDRIKLGPAALAGSLFAVGLYISQMVYPTRVLGFLNIAGVSDGTWDPTLCMVMGSGVIMSWLSYQFLDDYRVCKISSKTFEYPIALRRGSKFGIPTIKAIDGNLIFGALNFGIGWGLAGLCPGPAMFLGAVGVPPIVYLWWPAFFFGSYLAKTLKEYQDKGYESLTERE